MDLSSLSFQWLKNHKESDRARQQAERRAEADKRHRELALAKLSSEDRRVLGLAVEPLLLFKLHDLFALEALVLFEVGVDLLRMDQQVQVALFDALVKRWPKRA